jgi:uncharacterized protein with ParB-like and HNH nuclease domain
MANEEKTDLFDGDYDSDEEYSFTEYDVTSSPNDFNVKTIYDFIISGSIKIPDFQRNYVWDLKRASKLIESIITGIPIPQIFLYEKSKNNFLVIDGQQRLMTIYYFINKRFPNKDKRSELRDIYDEHRKIPQEILENDDYFAKFNLKLPGKTPDKVNRLNKLNYDTLDEYKRTFELRPIRMIIIKQNAPPNDDSVIFEIFNRLNSGGVNLAPQEIRVSLYYSDFYKMLKRINQAEKWRILIGQDDPDIHMKDIEIILRGFAMLMEGNKYKPSMTRFLNTFSENAKKFPKQDIDYLEKLFYSFLDKCIPLGDKIFISKKGKFNISMYEAIFSAICKRPYENRNFDVNEIDATKFYNLKENPKFIDSIQSHTTNTEMVKARLNTAREALICQ